jgi:hypothetical protein
MMLFSKVTLHGGIRKRDVEDKEKMQLVQTECYLIEFSEHSKRMPISRETNLVLKSPLLSKVTEARRREKRN